MNKETEDRALKAAHGYFWLADDPSMLELAKSRIVRILGSLENVSVEKLTAAICHECVKREAEIEVS